MASRMRAGQGSHVGVVVGALRARRQTQAELVDSTELSRVTLHERLQSLLDAGLIAIATTQLPTGGRPASIYEINRDFGRLLVADVGSSVTRVGIADLSGRLLASEVAEVDAVASADGALRHIFDGFTRFAAAQQLPILGAGIGVPVPIDPETYQVVDAASFPSWRGVDVLGTFKPMIRGPLVIGRDVTLMAVGEQRTMLPEASTTVMLKIGMGVGCAVLLGGEPLVGDHGRAFEIGHLPFAGSKGRCECRRVGCLETVAGGRSIIRELTWRGISATSSMDIMALAVAGNPLVRDLLFETGRKIGTMVAPIVDLLDPGAVIVGGNLVTYSDLVVQGMRESLMSRPASQMIATPRILPSVLGGEAGLRGAALLALDQVLAPHQVDRYVSAV